MHIFSATCLVGVMIMMVGASPIPNPAMPSLISVSPILSDPPISKRFGQGMIPSIPPIRCLNFQMGGTSIGS
ncbi:hypothetical protein B0H14DRAFT_3009152, partial [Mycena olivaceomarginata]